MKRKYYGSRDLIDRLCNAAESRKKTITFLVGSPLSKPDNEGGHGVPGTSEIVKIIGEEFSDPLVAQEFETYISKADTNQYQRAFEFLHGRRGQDTANKIVRKAVWQAIDINNWPKNLPNTTPEEADQAICQRLEEENLAWRIPSAVNIFGKLLVEYFDAFGETILTTNFDPLIEVSIARNGGNYFRTVVHQDGDLGQTVAEGSHIIHLHGYWHGSDTLHTTMQLTQHRPNLVNSLAKVISESILVVVGYGGWDDVVTNTLADILSKSDQNPEIMWAFYNDDVNKIESENENLLSALELGINRGRVSLYRNVGCLELFAEIYEKLQNIYPSGFRSSARFAPLTTVGETVANDTGRRELQIQINIPIQPQISAESDRPLFVDHWVGRELELGILAAVGTPVVFVTGIGGQGKSALAGRFLQEHAEATDGEFSVWDWRDCREESDRLSTQILRIVERLSKGAIDVGQIEVSDIRAVVGMLFQVLGDKRALLVFDNVDQYVDLETLQPIRGLDHLISEAQARRHNSLLLFTCRPDVQVDESRATRIPLSGLNLEETIALMSGCGISDTEHDLGSELQEITKGHPLWIRLIAMQAVRVSRSLREAIDIVRRGDATLPDTTRTIWRSLNEQQRTVLRTMAELDRPETENKLLDLIPGVNANRVNRALRTLRSFHLIESRRKNRGELLLGLHPIIREFVRTNFPKKDREVYVGWILNYLDKTIARFRDLLPNDPSYEILEHWIRKAEFQISFGRFEDATNTIFEVSDPLANRGYSEELVRLGRLLFDSIDWPEACVSYRKFDQLFQICLKEMIEFGYDEVDRYLDRYKMAISGKSSQYILLCDLECYSHWYRGSYDFAIKWGEEGEKLRDKTSVDTTYSTKHNLALARRDGGYVSEALDSFLEGEDLLDVIAVGERIEGKSAHFYGNIGRCLFLIDDFDRSLQCYVKSAQILEERRNESHRLNKGYARFWIGEVFLVNGKMELAASAFRAAELIWHTTSPFREKQAREKLEFVISKQLDLSGYRDMDDWKAESKFRNWLEEE